MTLAQRWYNVDFQLQRSPNGPNNISTLGQRYHAIWDVNGT